MRSTRSLGRHDHSVDNQPGGNPDVDRHRDDDDVKLRDERIGISRIDCLGRVDQCGATV
jgi:hypothetical protein